MIHWTCHKTEEHYHVKSIAHTEASVTRSGRGLLRLSRQQGFPRACHKKSSRACATRAKTRSGPANVASLQCCKPAQSTSTSENSRDFAAAGCEHLTETPVLNHYRGNSPHCLENFNLELEGVSLTKRDIATTSTHSSPNGQDSTISVATMVFYFPAGTLLRWRSPHSLCTICTGRTRPHPRTGRRLGSEGPESATTSVNGGVAGSPVGQGGARPGMHDFMWRAKRITKNVTTILTTTTVLQSKRSA